MSAHDAARHIYEQWHACRSSHDLEGLAALYADDAVLESPLAFVRSGEARRGVIRGRAAIRDFFGLGFKTTAKDLGHWREPGVFFSNGDRLIWEYPRETPNGDQTDLLEVIDIKDGLIASHRVYWGWVGYQTLNAVQKA